MPAPEAMGDNARMASGDAWIRLEIEYNPSLNMSQLHSSEGGFTRRAFMKKTSLAVGAITLLAPGLGLADDMSSDSSGLPCTSPGGHDWGDPQSETTQSPFTGKYIKHTWTECKNGCGAKKDEDWVEVPPP
jgi:hypothetical protein